MEMIPTYMLLRCDLTVSTLRIETRDVQNALSLHPVRSCKSWTISTMIGQCQQSAAVRAGSETVHTLKGSNAPTKFPLVR